MTTRTNRNQTFDESGNVVEEEIVEVEAWLPDTERISVLEARLEAVAALAERANVTAQEVAQAAARRPSA